MGCFAKHCPPAPYLPVIVLDWLLLLPLVYTECKPNNAQPPPTSTSCLPQILPHQICGTSAPPLLFLGILTPINHKSSNPRLYWAALNVQQSLKTQRFLVFDVVFSGRRRRPEKKKFFLHTHPFRRKKKIGHHVARYLSVSLSLSFFWPPKAARKIFAFFLRKK